MNITKDLLNYFGIISVSIKIQDSDIICFLTKQIENTWIIDTKYDEIAKNQNIEIKINFKDSNPEIIKTVVIEKEKNLISVRLPQNFTNQQKKVEMVFLRINELEQKDKKFGRRKEERIKITKANCSNFMIKSIEQELILKNQILPCAIIDVSIHGICIITQYSPFFSKELDNFKVRLSFTDYTSPVIIQCHKVHARLAKTKSKDYITLSCQVLEPIHFEWKNHVISILEQLENKVV